MKTQRRPCEEFILKYLEKVGESTVEITNGKLRKNQCESKVPLNQEIIKDAITDKVGDPQITEDIIRKMDAMRPVKTRTNLKRTGKRQKELKDGAKAGSGAASKDDDD